MFDITLAEWILEHPKYYQPNLILVPYGSPGQSYQRLDAFENILHNEGNGSNLQYIVDPSDGDYNSS